MKNTLQVAAQGDHEILMTRVLDAPRHLVFDAFTKPELLKRWLGALEGWEWAVCEIDLRVGGKYRWVWKHENGMQMGISGVYREIVPPEKIVSTERFDEAWYPGEGLGTVLLTEEGGKTTVRQTVRYETREARDGVLKSPMESGVSASYNQLQLVLDSITGAAA
ncbi:MAG TPA: SRPBCC family protein [Candidatus Angelobacter sp.]|jgi:uncharacterized protein YndB with AHSA1/START domain